MAHADVVEVHKTEHHIITIFYDPRPENPIQACDYFGTFYMWHKHYQLGNQNPYKTPKAFLADTHNANCENNFDGVILPISMTDHSGLTLNIGAPQDSWDSGRVGYICVSRLDCIKEGYNIVNNEDKEKVVERLENTINVLNDYLLGKVYFYQITTRTNTEIVEEQSGGHVGEIKDCVESALERAKEMDREYEMTMWKDPGMSSSRGVRMVLCMRSMVRILPPKKSP